MTPFRIGLLGASEIAKTAIIEPAKLIDGLTINGVASRNNKKAHDYSTAYQIPYPCDSYGELIGRDDIDLVYISLPASLHEEWVLKALAAGKHVLCEKPAAISSVSANKMVSAAQIANLRLIEGFHYRYHPFFKFLLELLSKGKMGKIEKINAILDVPLPPNEGENRWRPDMGGGVMNDIGCYPVHWFRTILGEFEVLSSNIQFAASGVDEKVTTNLKFANNALGTIDVSMTPHNRKRFSKLDIVTSSGEINLQNIVLPHLGHVFRWCVNDNWFEEQFSNQTTYFYQLIAIRDAIIGGTCLPTEGQDIINNATKIEDILRAHN